VTPATLLQLAKRRRGRPGGRPCASVGVHRPTHSYLDAGTNPDEAENNLDLVRADFTPKERALAAFEKAMRRQ
jgi:hypothetical protein